MDFVKKISKDFDFIKLLKVVGITLLVILAVALVWNLIRQIANVALFNGQQGGFSIINPMAPSRDSVAGESFYGDEKASSSLSPILSSRNMGGVVYRNDSATGNSEEFEVTRYSASIESRNVDNVCSSIAGLKSLSYVIFENASEYDAGCAYSFKVEKVMAMSVLETIKALKPRDLNEYTNSIKREIDDFTGEEEILKSKLNTIEETLETAIKAYDGITKVAIDVKDAESLANIINSKLRMIQQLTAEKIAVAEQLDRLSRTKAQSLDSVLYTYFNVNIYENKFFDWKTIKDSWKNAVRNFVSGVNRSIQEISVYLLSFIVRVAVYLVYIFFVLLVAKYGWVYVKRVWKS